ncbi:MAG: GNAT family N-acetyltransferase [Candidatus Bathyarchaeia archaeon]
MLNIRTATLEDLPHIIKLIKRNNELLNENLETLFNVKNPNEKCKFFVAEEKGQIVGYSRVHLYRWNNSAYVICLLADTESRRRGIGTALLMTMESYAKENGSRVLMFDTRIDNFPALNLYFKNGFKICGYNDKLYENGKTALYLFKEL